MDLHEPFEGHEHATTSLKVLLLIFAVVLIAALGYFVYQTNTTPDSTDYSAKTVKDAAATNDATETATTETTTDDCDFTKTTVTLKTATTYDLGGGEEFDTLVCGYLTQKEENMALEGDEPLTKNRAYLTVTKFQDEKFKAALDKQISDGNTVNSAAAGTYQLGCGCYENSKIVSDTGDLTDAASQVKLLASTKDKPVMVKLGFQVHAGRGCSCCNLVDKLEVI